MKQGGMQSRSGKEKVMGASWQWHRGHLCQITQGEISVLPRNREALPSLFLLLINLHNHKQSPLVSLLKPKMIKRGKGSTEGQLPAQQCQWKWPSCGNWCPGCSGQFEPGMGWVHLTPSSVCAPELARNSLWEWSPSAAPWELWLENVGEVRQSSSGVTGNFTPVHREFSDEENAEGWRTFQFKNSSNTLFYCLGEFQYLLPWHSLKYCNSWRPGQVLHGKW